MESALSILSTAPELLLEESYMRQDLYRMIAVVAELLTFEPNFYSQKSFFKRTLHVYLYPSSLWAV